AEPVRIGAIFGRTGIAAGEMAYFINAVELAVEQINDRGGLLGRPAELMVLDNRSTPIGASRAAEEAVGRGVTAVIGASWSTHSLAMAPILQKAGIPMISPSSTNPKVTRVGNYIFRACFIDSFQGKVMARFAREELGVRSAAVLKIINEEYSLVLAEFFIRHFKKFGGDKPWVGSYKVKAVDFSDLLKKVKKLKPDVLYIPGYSRDSGLLIRQAVSMGIKPTFLGGDGWNKLMYRYIDDLPVAGYYSTHWSANSPTPESVHLLDAYKKKFGGELLVPNAALAHDAVMLLADAVRRAGSSNRAEIRDALAETRGFKGVTGPITFNENGDPVNKTAVIMKLGEKAPRIFKTVRLKPDRAGAPASEKFQQPDPE
ncbi:MAG: ABC transporter substrate-binding protein, partial [Desulfobacterales bacterium]|nr:ABC transporter substrate-binding protein [Desulfobacterales bacterium]